MDTQRLADPPARYRSLGRMISAGQAKLASDAGLNAPALRTVRAMLEIEEIWTSMRLADTPLERTAVEALVRRGVAVGGHRLEAYVAVADYARAALLVREAPAVSRRHDLLSVDEIVRVHARVAARAGGRAGKLRSHSLGPLAGGIIAPPPWLLPQALAAFVERVRLGPPTGTEPLSWVATSHARFERLHPFDDANGRVGRCLVNLLLRRLGYLAFIARPRDASAYRAALRTADARNPWPLATLLAQSLARSYALVCASLPGTENVRPLCEFAVGKERAALYKAAQRGRLRSFRRDGRLHTAQTWIDDYRAS